MIRQGIAEAVKGALLRQGYEVQMNFVVERPSSFEHGDYATNAALAVGKMLKKNPKEVAQALKKELDGKLPDVEKIEVAGVGFINFFLSRDAIVKEVSSAATSDSFGKNDLYAHKKIMVEYTDPNPFKEFHIGHLMSNAIGESIARILESSGAKVTRANYQGDVGLHVAKAIFGLQHRRDIPLSIGEVGMAYVFGSQRYEESPEDKQKIDTINKAVYEKGSKYIELYESGRAVSLAHFDVLYKMLGTRFDKSFFESETTSLGVAIVKNNPDIFVESSGARVFHGEEEGLHTRVFLTSQGLPTYEAKDLGLLELKNKVDIDTSITVTASEQKEYFKVVLAAAKRISGLKEIAEKTTHITHGMMRFADSKMSSRKGNVITGESLLADLIVGAHTKMGDRKIEDVNKIAEQVAVGAIKYAVLKQGSGKDIIFDPEKSLSLEGDSGPYLQYAHTRALSLLKMAGRESVEPNEIDKPTTSSNLERLLVHFPDTVAHAAQELEPHYVTTYLTELAAAFNSWYANERIIGGANPHYGVLLAQAVEATLKKGLQILGIPAPEEM